MATPSSLQRTLTGKVAVVVGASGGIGGAIARELACRGARLVLAGRRTDRLEALRSQLDSNSDSNSSGGRSGGHVVVGCDIRDPGSIDRLAQEARKLSSADGGIDVLVNSAGVSRDSLLLRVKETDVAETLETNLVGVIRTCKALVPLMVRRKRDLKSASGRGGGASVINIASVIGMHGNTGQSTYAASKAGVIGFTKSLAKEVASRGICANVLSPGFISTEMTSGLANNKITSQLLDRIPLQAPGSVEDVAHAAAFLAEARYITGQVLVVDGGLFI
ncbi:hypothetical protein H4217_005345 [Coemansia sp. RSA 1939]|nr:hypothetical protein H4217_005345 [Coemansia sp. RSA 1939]KAJ2616130.1 hypothetical protein EV177_001215 [Coemansia sp. RSA 1804]KAJ2671821.1 hypothetical protein GGH99_006144 [Coemansia sp. RSA 1285]